MRCFVIACALCLLSRAPSFRYGVISDDEAIYDAMAQEIRAGGVMYRDTVDHKPPGLVYTYAAVQQLGSGMAAVHLTGLLAVLGTIAGLYAIGRRLLPDAAAMPALLYVLSSAAKQPVDGLAVNGELLMNLPTVWAAWAAITATRKRSLTLDLWAGALCAIALLYKYQAAVLGLALFALLDFRQPAQAARRTIAWLLGAALPLTLCAAYFAERSALADAFSWGIDFNRRYLSDAPPLAWALRRLGWQFVGVVLPSALLYGAGLATLLRIRPQSPEQRFLVVWSALALTAVFLGGRFFGHYFLQPELPLALLAAELAARLFRHRPRTIAVAIGLPAFTFWIVALSPPLHHRLFDADSPNLIALGEAIADRTRPDQTIWVWGNVPQIYHAAQRRPGVRFPFCNYLTGLSPATPSEYDPAVDPHEHAVAEAWPLVFHDLESRRPALVIDTAAAGMKGYGKFPIASFPKLDAYLQAHYHRAGEISGAVLYHRSDG